jgi:hypothetical protein
MSGATSDNVHDPTAVNEIDWTTTKNENEALLEVEAGSSKEDAISANSQYAYDGPYNVTNNTAEPTRNLDADSIVKDIKHDMDSASASTQSTRAAESGSSSSGFNIFRSVLLCVLNIIAMSGVLVTLPLVAGGFSDSAAQSDSYVGLFVIIMWFPVVYLVQLVFVKLFIDRSTPLKPSIPWSYMVISGSFLGIGIALTSFAAPPSRTPPYLQAILQTLTVPFTVIARLVVVRKGLLSLL